MDIPAASHNVMMFALSDFQKNGNDATMSDVLLVATTYPKNPKGYRLQNVKRFTEGFTALYNRYADYREEK